MKVGFLVNPIAGMGGSVGLKGTDGEETLREARRRGATEAAPQRAMRALRSIRSISSDGRSIEFLTCEGWMGKMETDAVGVPAVVVYTPAEVSSGRDTQAAARIMHEHGAELIVFVGGDGTARDLLDAIGQKVPIVGVPAGVKMHSAVFAHTPEEAGEIVNSFVRQPATKQAEVMDIDEELFRKGTLKAKLFGYALVPDDPEHLQSGKSVYHSGSAEDEAEEIGQYLADTMEPGVLYILGPGSTTAHIARILGENKTLLGVDAFLDRRNILADAGEKDLLELLKEKTQAFVVVTPIGSQGFLFGRGNQQLSPRVLRAVGTKNVIVIATPSKLRDTPVLRADTGDPDLDRTLKGPTKVVTGYRRRRLVTLV